MPIFNPHKIPCILCGVTDCEHFDIPDDGKPLSRFFMQMINAGFSPFVYAPYIPLVVTSTDGIREFEGPQVRRCVSDSGRETIWLVGHAGREAVREVRNYGAGLLGKYKERTEGVGALRPALRRGGREVRAVQEVCEGGERSRSDPGEERGQ